MRSLFLTLSLLFIWGANAQEACCTATKTFANLGADSQFKLEHQLPATGAKLAKTGQWQTFATEDGKTGRGYFVKAKSESNKYLFIFHEWWGLNDNILREAEEWGKTFPEVNIIALDLYDGLIGTTREAASKLMQGADETRIRAIIEGARIWAGEDAQIATMGWCFGGGWSMQAALQLQEQTVACVVYYGMPEQNPEKLADLNCKVLGIFAEQDKWINRDVVATYEKAMSEAGKAFETHWFDANHAFANPSNPVFDKKAAGQANALTKDYLVAAFGQ